MSTFINIRNFFVYFSIIFFASFLFFLLKMMNIYSSVFSIENMNYIYLFFVFFINYFFPLSIFASILTILLISTGKKLRGNISIIISLLVIAFLGVIYPVYIKYINYNSISSFLFPQSIELDATSFKKQMIYNNGGNFIYVDNLGTDTYQYENILILDNYNLIDAKYANENKGNLELVDVNIIDIENNTKKHYDKYDFQIDDNNQYDTILDTFFAFPFLKYFSIIFIFFTDVNTPFYIYIILYISLFLLLVGFYVLGGTLSVEGLEFHNIMVSFSVYSLFILMLNIILTLISKRIPIYNLLYGLGAVQSSLVILFLSIALNIFAFLLHYTLRFDKYYKN